MRALLVLCGRHTLHARNLDSLELATTGPSSYLEAACGMEHLPCRQASLPCLMLNLAPAT